METPSLHVAKKIIDRFVHEKLLTEQDGKKILPKLADGKLRPEDWQLAVELSGEKEIKP
jgi:hypothetical protein